MKGRQVRGGDVAGPAADGPPRLASMKGRPVRGGDDHIPHPERVTQASMKGRPVRGGDRPARATRTTGTSSSLDEGPPGHGRRQGVNSSGFDLVLAILSRSPGCCMTWR